MVWQMHQMCDNFAPEIVVTLQRQNKQLAQQRLLTI
jgi:hypothetical protein